MPNCNHVSFTDDEYDQLANLLIIVQNELVRGAIEITSLQPQARIIERMRIQAEAAEEFRCRIEAR